MMRAQQMTEKLLSKHPYAALPLRYYLVHGDLPSG